MGMKNENWMTRDNLYLSTNHLQFFSYPAQVQAVCETLRNLEQMIKQYRHEIEAMDKQEDLPDQEVHSQMMEHFEQQMLNLANILSQWEQVPESDSGH